MKTGFRFYYFFLIILFISSCTKDYNIVPEKTDEGLSLKLNINYKVDGFPLIFDTIMYHNLAGNNYGVTRLEYYISNITFHSTSGKDFALKNIFYMNARTPSTNSISIDHVPAGQYTDITLNIGIDSANNKTNSLPNTSENINMAWPSSMGGGYHFMKLEGYYVNTPSTTGFTMHLGQNTSLVTCLIQQPFQVSSSTSEIKLSMNLNEWFCSPIMYDFNADGNFIMGDMQAMGKITANGIDVFTLE